MNKFLTLPEKERMRMIQEEGKQRVLELKEIKQNMWKKWRGK